MKYNLLILLSLSISINSFNLRSTKQTYDSYVFALEWTNGYCLVNKCNSDIYKLEPNIFNIHGLWPSLKSGKLLNPCTSGVQIKEKESNLFTDMRKYWPSFKGEYTDFWEHEYNKHGYCMVEEKNWKGYEDYFKFVIDLYLKEYKDLIKAAFDNDTSRKMYTITYEDLSKRIQKVIKKANFKMMCSGGFIYEFYFYLNKDYTPSLNSKYSGNCKSGKLIFK